MQSQGSLQWQKHTVWLYVEADKSSCDVTAYLLKTHLNIILSSTLKSQFIASLQVSKSKFCDHFSLPLLNPAQLHLIILNDK